MRVTTDFWVSSVIRRVFSSGGFAAIVKRGATEAGAVFFTVRDRLGETKLYGPASQTSYDDAKPADRQFTLLGNVAGDAAIEARLEREKRFDPDIWIVEIETGQVPVEELLSIATT